MIFLCRYLDDALIEYDPLGMWSSTLSRWQRHLVPTLYQTQSRDTNTTQSNNFDTSTTIIYISTCFISISYTALRQSQNFQNKNQFRKYSGSLYTNELRLLPVPRREPSHSHFEVFKTPPSSTSHVLLINVNTKGSVRVVTPPTMKMEANACQRATNSRRMIALH